MEDWIDRYESYLRLERNVSPYTLRNYSSDLTQAVRRYKMAAMKDYSYTVIFEPLERGGYQTIVPALPEIITDGRTLKEARRMARDAIRSRLTLPDGVSFKVEPSP